MARLSWEALAKGTELPSLSFELSPGWVKEYVEAVDDRAIGELGSGVVPPMAVAALAIRSLLEAVELPPGALHVGQELQFLRPLEKGEKLRSRARVVSRGQRAGWALVAIDLRAEDGAGQTVMTGRTTVVAPASDNG